MNEISGLGKGECEDARDQYHEEYTRCQGAVIAEIYIVGFDFRYIYLFRFDGRRFLCVVFLKFCLKAAKETAVNGSMSACKRRRQSSRLVMKASYLG